MKTIDKIVIFVTVTLFLMEVFPSRVCAYLDPSAITYTVQLVAGLVIAAGAALVIFRHKLSKLFHKIFGGKKAEEKKQIHLKDDDKTDDSAENATEDNNTDKENKE